MSIRRTRPRGFAAWNPRAEARALVEDVQRVLDEYWQHLPLTARQVFYRLVATRGFDKTEAAYSRLCETLNRARRAGLIAFEDIRDDGTSRYENPFFADAMAFYSEVQEQAAQFQLDRQRGQRRRLWLLCEAGGMAPMLARAAAPFGVPVLTSGGFDSLTAKYRLAEEVAKWMRGGVEVEVLHIGDHDPSGVHLFTSLAEDVRAMAASLAQGRPLPIFTRLAVTEDQVVTLNLPTAPPKATDRRAFVGETVQAEAIDPATLAEIVKAAITARRDREAERLMLEIEAEIRAGILARLGVEE